MDLEITSIDGKTTTAASGFKWTETKWTQQRWIHVGPSGQREKKHAETVTQLLGLHNAKMVPAPNTKEQDHNDDEDTKFSSQTDR